MNFSKVISDSVFDIFLCSQFQIPDEDLVTRRRGFRVDPLTNVVYTEEKYNPPEIAEEPMMEEEEDEEGEHGEEEEDEDELSGDREDEVAISNASYYFLLFSFCTLVFWA